MATKLQLFGSELLCLKNGSGVNNFSAINSSTVIYIGIMCFSGEWKLRFQLTFEELFSESANIWLVGKGGSFYSRTIGIVYTYPTINDYIYIYICEYFIRKSLCKIIVYSCCVYKGGSMKWRVAVGVTLIINSVGTQWSVALSCSH